jgi:DNA-binding SARP family transcriptional activator
MTLTEPHSTDASRLRISVLGGFKVMRENGETLPVPNRKAAALLAYLALRKGSSEPRERLAGLFWSESDELRSRTSLRQTLKQLRAIFLEAQFVGLENDRDSLSINPDGVVLDVDSVADQVRGGEVPPSLLDPSMAPDRLLYGFDTLDESFSSWLQVYRQTWSNRLTAPLTELLNSPDSVTAGRAANALLQIDPMFEAAHLQILSKLASEGNTASALKYYKTLWDYLDAEFEVEPSPEIQSLVVSIKDGTYSGGAPAADPVVAPSPAPIIEEAEVIYPRLDVAAFSVTGDQEADFQFLEGFRQDLIASLVRFREWTVRDVADGDAVPESGVGFRIDGSCFMDKGQNFLVLTLINLTNRRYLWSEKIPFEPSGWLDAQRRIVIRLASSLNLHLNSLAIRPQLSAEMQKNGKYLKWLKANELTWTCDNAVYEEAEQLFREVLASHPDFPLAHSGLASILNSEHMSLPGRLPVRSRLQEAAKLSRQAVSMDPLDVRNHIALAWSYGMNRNYSQASVHHHMVRELNPNNPTTLISSANGLAMCGETDLARSISDEAVSLMTMLTPVQWAYLASTRFVCGDHAACLEACELGDNSIPTNPGWKAAAAGLVAETSDALAAGEAFLAYIEETWQGSDPFSPKTATTWFLAHCPVRNEAVVAKIKEGLSNAGLPVA